MPTDSYQDVLNGELDQPVHGAPQGGIYGQVLGNVTTSPLSLDVPRSVNERIAFEAKRVTAAQIAEERARLHEQVPFIKRWAFGIDYSDDDIANMIAQDRLFPQGLIGPPEQPMEAERIMGAFPAAMTQTILQSIPVFTSKGSELRQSVMGMPLPEGASASLGAAVGEVATIGVGFIVPPLSMPIFTAKAGAAAQRTLDETGNTTAAIGSAMIEFATEALGYRLIGPIAERSAASLGHAVLGRNFKQAAKTMTGALIASGIEITEEQAALIGDEVIRWATGVQDIETTGNRISEQFVPTTVQAGLVGAMLMVPAMLSPAARRRFRAAMDSRDQAEIRAVLTEAGVDAQTVEQIVQAVEPVEQAEPEASVNIAEEIKQSTPQQLDEAAQELRTAIDEDSKAEPDDRMDAQQRQAIEYVQNAIQREQEVRAESAQLEPDIVPVESLPQQTQDIAQQEETQTQPEPTQQEFGPRARETKKTKALLERIGLMPKEKMVTVTDALKASIKAQQRAARIADRLARSETRAKFQEKINKVRTELIAAKRAAVEKVRSEGQERVQRIKDQFRQNIAQMRRLRKALSQDIRENMPKAIQGKMIATLANVETATQTVNALKKMQQILEDHQTAEVHKDLTDLFKSIELNKIKEPLRQRVQAITIRLQEKPLSDEKRAELESRREHANRTRERLPQAVMEELARLDQTPITSLDRDQTENVIAELTSLLNQNDLFQRLTSKRAKAERRSIAQTMGDEIAVSNFFALRRIMENDQAPRAERDPTIATVPFRLIENLMPRALAKIIGGGNGSRSYEVLYGNLDKAFESQLAGYFNDMDALHEALRSLGFDVKDPKFHRMSAALAGQYGLVSRIITGRDNKAQIDDVELADGTKVKMTAAERMGLLAMLADTETYDLIVFQNTPVAIGRTLRGKSFKLTADDVVRIEQQTSAAEHALIQFIVDRINGPLKQVFKQWSFTQFGVDRSREGVHFPRKRRLEDASDKIDTITSENFGNLYPRQAGIVKERTSDTKNPLLVRDIFAVFSNYSWQTHGIANLDGAIQTARQALSSAEVETALDKQKGGQRVKRRFTQMYDALAKMVMGGNDAVYAAERGVVGLFNNVQRGILGLNPRVVLYQPVSMVNALRFISVKNMTLAIQSAFDSSIDARIFTASPYLRFRNEGSHIGLVNEGGISSRDIIGLSPSRERVMSGIRWADHAAVRILWRAAELQAQSEGLTGNDLAFRVKTLAEKVIKETQPTFDPLHVSSFALEARARPFFKVLTFFRSQASKDLSAMMETFMDAKTTGHAGYTQFIKTALIVMMDIMLVELLTEMWNASLGGVEDEELEKIASRFVSRVATLPIGGDYLGVALQKWLFPNQFHFEPSNPFASAISDTMSGTGRMLERASKLQFDEKFVDGLEDVAIGVSTLTGVPVQALIRDIKRVAKRFDN